MSAFGWLLFFLSGVLSLWTQLIVLQAGWERRQKLGSLWLGLSATFLTGTLWTASVLLSMIVPGAGGMWARHISRLLGSWTALAIAITLLWVATQGHWSVRWLGLALGMTHLALWLRNTPPAPGTYTPIEIPTPVLPLRWITYTPYPMVKLNMISLAIAGWALLLYARHMLGLVRRYFIWLSLLLLVLVAFTMLGPSVLHVPNPWDLLIGVLWLPALVTWHALRSQPHFTPVTIEQITQHLNEGVLVLTPDHRPIWHNAAAARLLGIQNPRTTLSQPTTQVETVLQQHTDLWRWIRRPPSSPTKDVFYIHTPEGPRFLQAWLVPVGDDKQRRSKIVYLRDVTEQEVHKRVIQIRYQEARWMARLLELMLQPSPLELVLRDVLKVFLQPLPSFQALAAALYVYDGENERFDLAAVLKRPHADLQESIPLQSIQGLGQAPWPGDFVFRFAIGHSQALLFPLRQGGEWQGLLWLEIPRTVHIEEDEHQLLVRTTALLAHLLQAKAVAEYRQRLSKAFHQAREALVLFHLPQGTVEFINPTAERLAHDWGLESHAFPKQILTQKHTWDEIVARMHEGRAWEFLYEHQGPDNTMRFYRVWCVPLQTRENTPPSVALLALQDVTEYESLTRQIQRQANFIEQLVRLSQAMLEGRLRLVDVLKRILETAQDMVEAEGGTLILVDQDLTPYALFTKGNLFPPGEFTYQAIREGLAGWVLRHRQSEIIDNTKNDQRWLPGSYREWGSVLSVPIYYGDTPLAVLTLSHTEPGHFTPEHQELLEAAAHITALALYTARLYEEHYFLAQQLTASREESESLYARQQRFFRLLNQALQPSVEYVRREWERLHEYYFDQRKTPPETLTRLWEIWQELERLFLVLETYQEQQRESISISTFPLTSVVQRVERLLHPLIEQHPGRVTIQIEPATLILDSDEHKVFHVLFNLLYWALAALQPQGPITLHIRSQGAHWVMMELTLPGQPLDEDTQRALRHLTTEELDIDPLIESPLPDPKLNLLIGLMRQLRGYLQVEIQPRTTVLRLYLPRSLEKHAVDTASLH